MKSWFRREWPSLVVIAAGLLVQVLLVTRSLTFLLANVLPDDAFYYFDIARSVVMGHGSTFNGIDPTNGYHPLWLIVLLPVFKCFYTTAHDLTPIRIALLIAVALNVVTALLVLRILSRFTASSSIRALGMVAWVLNPFLLFESINGLETALALCLFSLFFLLMLRIEEGKSSRYWLAGIVGGFMVLARIDMVFYVAAYLGWVLIRLGWSDGYKKALIAGIAAAVPIAPFLVWNVVNFHMLLTGSSSTEAMVNHQLIIQDHGPSYAQFLKAMIYETQYELVVIFQRTGMFSIIFGFVGAAVSLSILGIVRLPQRVKELSATQCMFLGFVALFIADASIRWTARTWYFVSFDLFVAILVVIVANALIARVSYKRTVVAVLAALMLFSFSVDWSKDIRDQFASQTQMYAAAQWMSTNLPAGSKIGVFNAGIQEYFSTQTIVDLDGLVNNNAYEAMHARDLSSYIKRDNIAYIADFDEYLTYRYKSFFGVPNPFADLSFIYTIDGATTTAPSSDGLNIYKVK